MYQKQHLSLIEKCLEHLATLPNIQVNFRQIPQSLNNEGTTGILTIASSTNSVDYIFRILPSITEVEAFIFTSSDQIFNGNKERKQIIVTPYLTDSIIEYLLNQDIEFIDSTGNIYLNSAAAYVFIRAQNSSKGRSSSSFEINSTTLKIIYILLKSPSILEAPPQEIADKAGVPLESISNNLKNLYYLGYLERKRNGGYWIVNYTRLLERWEMGYVECLRPELLLGNFTFQQKHKFSLIAPTIINLASYTNFLIGGELGAAIATDYLYPQSVVIHFYGNYDLIVNKLKLIPSPQGEVILMQQFGTQNAYSDKDVENIADPLLIHAELIKENNDRLNSTANRLFDKYIEIKRLYA